MKTLKTDIAILGAGSAGMSAYRTASEHTTNLVVIEGSHYGTTCARVGCMPSKLLISAADAAHAVQGAAAFGVHAGPSRIDGVEVMDRVRRERDRFVGFVVGAVHRWPEAHRLDGFARFLSPHELLVGSDTMVVADRIVIATGSSPAVPPGWREALGDKLLVNDDVFAWKTLPASIAVVGTGVIGLEIAQALHRLGVRVRLFGRSDRLGPLTDPALQAVARSTLGAELDVVSPVRDLVPRLDSSGRVQVRATMADGSGVVDTFDCVLVAIGRRANVGSLGLENAGIALDASGIPTVDRRTGQIDRSHIFLAGDVAEDRQILHEASDDGRIAGDNAGRYPHVRIRPRRAPLSIVFSDPQIMLAGQTHAELVASGMEFMVGEASFDDQGRSRVMLKNRGAIRVYGEAGTGRFLGAEMIGPSAEHIGHLLAWSVQRGDTVQQMLDSAFYHPVVEEGLRTALRQLQQRLALSAALPELCLDCIPARDQVVNDARLGQKRTFA
ncbi:dihydrolipoyl dehydrogenase [Lysobacter sp. MMG2]|uniref:dihydrolipoyl dehydrogenase n=1 Tax=Lysobacter sp. MMG2 TaxID=2801338 RepID=UPI001C21D03B|nr:dihydrolipoyl dehydrogenase [Lysobacter sp. MMG2]MBU8974792.1 dihydrolipoyl dehydrogenase [Lysobacter sp. MMG2]